jgi:L-ascorbate metabolism protein UlaG (beta-lactamase superfamily)
MRKLTSTMRGDHSMSATPDDTSASQVLVQTIGGPTAAIRYGGLRLVTDPTFDPPHEVRAGPSVRVKTTGPAVAVDDIGDVDAVLLSHDHHHDNLDEAGRAFLSRAARVLTTGEGAERLGGATVGLDPFETVHLPRPDGGTVRVTATPAEHGPSDFAVENGPVIGFILEADGLPAVYVSGDNASVEVVKAVADRFGTVPIAILFTGAASIPEKAGGAPLTLTAERAAIATRLLRARAAIPVHHHGWNHYAEDADDIRRAFAAAGISDRLLLPEPGAVIAA